MPIKFYRTAGVDDNPSIIALFRLQSRPPQVVLCFGMMLEELVIIGDGTIEVALLLLHLCALHVNVCLVRKLDCTVQVGDRSVEVALGLLLHCAREVVGVERRPRHYLRSGVDCNLWSSAAEFDLSSHCDCYASKLTTIELRSRDLVRDNYP